MDEKVLSFGDVLLTRSDVELLRGSAWLNDKVRGAVAPPLLGQQAHLELRGFARPVAAPPAAPPTVCCRHSPPCIAAPCS